MATGMLAVVNDACSYLQSIFPGIDFAYETRISLAISLDQADIEPEVVAEVAFELPDRDYAVENARYLRCIPPRDWIRCADQITPPDEGELVDRERRNELLDQGYTHDDFMEARADGSGQTIQWAFSPEDQDQDPNALPEPTDNDQ